ncbi:MAG: RAMP superfamily CRISPR-associated protein [Nanoarchaeota archaeon]|nr:RAMP superfamily CRISPR-associated protein [Nanoarchaeota archaeon]
MRSVSNDYFSKFEGKYVLNCNLLTLEPMRIGCSEPTGDTLSGLPIIVDNEGKPFIPGTSLKGVLRSALERVYATFGIVNSEDINALFGSPENKGKIVAHDAYLDSSIAFNTIEDKLHFGAATLGVRGNLIPLEAIGAGILFYVTIEIINGNETDAGNLLIALGELDSLRAGIGSWRSRGYGLVQVQGPMPDSPILLKHVDIENAGFVWSDVDVESTKEKAADKLRKLSHKPASAEGLEAYSHAYDESPSGTVACKFEIELLNDFHVRGDDEATVLSTDDPYIPGSVIKGFLRRIVGIGKFTTPWESRSNIIVGSATLNSGAQSKSVVEKDDSDNIVAIKKGAVLEGHIIFDNMGKEDIINVIRTLSKENIITGKTSAKSNPADKSEVPRFNKVKFRLSEATKFCADEEDFNLNITSQLKKAVD